ncbi:MAG: cytochrome c biogenesis protein CcsA, partial [Deltaproteobacteria bacterium]|nr:cytochrome c biogenesis protein CcsA [Deltaproteobacteria bacterium]
MSFVFFHITTVIYLVSTFVYIAYLVSHNERFEKIAKGMLYAGFGAHTVTIISRGIEALRTPAASLHESLTLFAWLIVALFIIVDRRYKLSVLGAFVAPFVLTIIITASFQSKEITPLSPVLKSYWLPFHIVIAFLGNAFFAIAFMLALMYLIQEHYLKSRKVKGLYF